MNGKRKGRDWSAAGLLGALLRDRGWVPVDLERESQKTGHPMRMASQRTVYRVLKEGYVPSPASQFEIAAVFGLLPSHIWGSAPLPDAFAYLTYLKVAA